MSGRKLSEVRSSLKVSDALRSEVGCIVDTVTEISEQLRKAGKPSRTLVRKADQLQAAWQIVQQQMGDLQRLVATRAGRGEQHGFDREYADAERICSELERTRIGFRELLNTARDGLSKVRDDLQKDLQELEQELDSTEIFTVLGGQTAAEFAETVGLGPAYLQEVVSQLHAARLALKSGNFATARSTFAEALKLWRSRLSGLQAFQDRCREARAFATATAEFFSVQRGYQVQVDFRQVPFTFCAKKAGAEYRFSFGKLISDSGDAAPIEWDTPHGDGCIQLIADLNRHLMAQGFLHHFSKSRSYPQQRVNRPRRSSERGQQP